MPDSKKRKYVVARATDSDADAVETDVPEVEEAAEERPSAKERSKQGPMTLRCNHPSDVYKAIGPVTGTVYAFSRGKPLPVDAADARKLLKRRIRVPSECCGGPTHREISLFQEVSV